MRDYLTIGCVPFDEPCAQVGKPHYSTVARRECNAYREALIAHYGPPPEDVVLAIKGFPHDFGTYHEVVVYYNPNDSKQCDYAFKIESGLDSWPPGVLDKIKSSLLADFGIDYSEVAR